MGPVEKDNNIFESEAPKPKNDSVFDHNAIALILFLVVLVVFSIAGCANDGTSTPASINNPNSAVPNTTTANQGFIAIAIAGAAPNDYSVRLKWPGFPSNQAFAMYRQDKTKSFQQLGTSKSSDLSFDDNKVTPGETYRYLLAAAANGAPQFLADSSITVPTDAVVSGKQLASDLKNFNRLFFTKDSKLETQGTTLTIQVNEIVSDDGVIRAFDQSQKAPTGQNGRSGGSIQISAKRGSGKLHVLAGGEAGGDGFDGTPGANGSNGVPGQPGDWGMNPETYKYLIKNFVDSFGNVMRRFPKPYTDSEWTRSVGNIPFYICARAPTSGTPGANGGPAADGITGGNGGDSAKVLVTILENSDLSIDIAGEPGLSGIGGRGGKGGVPGVGGPPGGQDQGHRCGPASFGPNGQPGIDGRQGRSGNGGMRLPVCARIGNQTIYDCDKFKESL